jgi:hypothetical protein
VLVISVSVGGRRPSDFIVLVIGVGVGGRCPSDFIVLVIGVGAGGRHKTQNTEHGLARILSFVVLH